MSQSELFLKYDLNPINLNNEMDLFTQLLTNVNIVD